MPMTAGPSDLARFIDAPVSGPPVNAQKADRQSYRDRGKPWRYAFICRNGHNHEHQRERQQPFDQERATHGDGRRQRR
jgi:hypothetical protein